MDQETYVRTKLTEANKTRGRLKRIARDCELDQRTVRALLDADHMAHDTTIIKLNSYFKKAARRVKP